MLPQIECHNVTLFSKREAKYACILGSDPDIESDAELSLKDMRYLFVFKEKPKPKPRQTDLRHAVLQMSLSLLFHSYIHPYHPSLWQGY